MRTSLSARAVRALPLTLLASPAPASADAATITQAADGAIVFSGGLGATSVDVGLGDDGRVRFSPGFGDEIGGVPPVCERPDDRPSPSALSPTSSGSSGPAVRAGGSVEVDASFRVREGGA